MLKMIFQKLFYQTDEWCCAAVCSSAIAQLQTSPIATPTDLDAIRPLFRFSNLREFYSGMVNFQFSDEHAMGATWPCLEVLNNNTMHRSSPKLRGVPLLIYPHVESTRLRSTRMH